MGSITSILPPQSPLTYLLVVLIPSLPSLYARFQQWRSPQHKHPSPPAPPRPLHLYLVLAIHTLYRIKQLIQPPFNVFHQYRLPLSTSPSILSAVFVRHASIYNSTISRPTDLSDQAQRLLARMGNVDYRIMYARYGHRVMEDCGWCSTHDDFAIASTPGIVGSYVGMAVFLGMLGWDVTAGEGATARADKMRASAAWVLVGAAVAEIGARYLWDLRMVEGDCLQLDAMCNFFRTALLLLHPLIYAFLPLSPSPSSNLINLLPSLHSTSNIIRLTSLARSSLSADPTLRAQSAALGKQAEAERQVARGDRWVNEAADRQGLGMQDGGGVRGHAKAWVREQWRGLVSVQNGPPPAPSSPEGAARSEKGR